MYSYIYAYLSITNNFIWFKFIASIVCITRMMDDT